MGLQVNILARTTRLNHLHPHDRLENHRDNVQGRLHSGLSFGVLALHPKANRSN